LAKSSKWPVVFHRSTEQIYSNCPEFTASGLNSLQPLNRCCYPIQSIDDEINREIKPNTEDINKNRLSMITRKGTDAFPNSKEAAQAIHST